MGYDCNINMGKIDEILVELFNNGVFSKRDGKTIGYGLKKKDEAKQALYKAVLETIEQANVGGYIPDKVKQALKELFEVK